MITTTYDPEQWQLVPKVATELMVHKMYMELTTNIECNGNDLYGSYVAALAAAPQHPDTIKIPRPEGHDSWSIEIKTSYGGGGGVGAKVGNYVGGGGGGSYPDTGETTSQTVAD